MISSITSARTVSKEETLDNIVNDSSIQANIERYLNKDKVIREKFRQITIDVIEGRVLVVGNVATEGDKNELVSQVFSVKDVKEVMDETEVSSISIKNKDGKESILPSTAKNPFNDFLIKQSIEVRLQSIKNIKNVNYTIIVFNGIVYLNGIATSAEELTNVSYIIVKTKGVQKLVNYARLINNQYRPEIDKSKNLKIYIE